MAEMQHLSFSHSECGERKMFLFGLRRGEGGGRVRKVLHLINDQSLNISDK